jgi:hypothetical protein
MKIALRSDVNSVRKWSVKLEILFIINGMFFLLSLLLLLKGTENRISLNISDVIEISGGLRSKRD